jgi:putative transposase
MPTPVQFKAPFLPQCHYHIVFKSVDGVKLFKTEENHDFFLKKFSLYLNPFCACLAYCLLDNHVHFVVQVKAITCLRESILAIPEEMRTESMKKSFDKSFGKEIVDEILERQVNRFMTSYANAFNKKFSRKGSLFQSPFRRIEIKEEAHLQQAIIYVHANAQKHGLVADFKDYKYSSYWEILYHTSAYVQVDEVLQFFGGKDQYINTHQSQIDHFYKNGGPSSKLE